MPAGPVSVGAHHRGPRRCRTAAVPLRPHCGPGNPLRPAT